MISALVGHLVGDYLLQNDVQALNKKRPGLKGMFCCVLHCAIWTASVCAFSRWFDVASVSVLFGSHFLQDRTNVVRWYMTAIGQEAFATGSCSPWSIIVVDNVFHVVTIWAVWMLLHGGAQ